MKKVICVALPEDKGLAVNIENKDRYVIGKVYDIDASLAYGGAIMHNGYRLCDVGSNVGRFCFKPYTNKSVNVLINL